MAKFRIITWNVENLFRPLPDASADERDRYDAKIKLIAGVLRGLDPDVVALQELGGADALADLATQMDMGALGQAISSSPDARGIRVGVISRLPLTVVQEIVGFPGGAALLIHDLDEQGQPVALTRMSRGALHVQVSAPEPMDVLITHMKSKLLSYKRPGGAASFVPRDEWERAQVGAIALQRRSAEATTLRLAANELLKARPTSRLILLGDLNDVPDAQTSLLLCGPSGSSIGTGGFVTPDKGDQYRMFNLTPLIAPDRAYSRISFGRRELIDQILVSQALLPRAGDGSDGKRQLPAVDSVVDFAQSLPSVGDDPGARQKALGPDHAPVMATFSLSPAT